MQKTGTSNLWVLVALMCTVLFYAPYWLYKQCVRQGKDQLDWEKMKLLIYALYLELACFYSFAVLYNALSSHNYLVSLLVEIFGISFYVTLVYSCIKYGKEIAKDSYPGPNWVAVFLFHVLYINDWQNSKVNS